MRKLKQTTYLFQLLFIVMSTCTVAFSQKLPKVQTASVKAPQAIKIDGKATEWNGQFQAYNKNNYIYYTISNDDKNVYLAAHMESGYGSQKIFRGGLTFTIVPASKKTDKLAITFPVITRKRFDDMEIGKTVSPVFTYKRLKGDTVANKVKIDELIASANNEMMTVNNQIHITGISGINDPLISVNNKDDIKVGASFDNKMNYTYELAIPIKYIEAALGGGKSFKYNIKLNADPVKLADAAKITQAAVQARSVRLQTALEEPPKPANGGRINPNNDDDFLFNTTDFSGEYTLAK